jgi:hypothetical protein
MNSDFKVQPLHRAEADWLTTIMSQDLRPKPCLLALPGHQMFRGVCQQLKGRQRRGFNLTAHLPCVILSLQLYTATPEVPQSTEARGVRGEAGGACDARRVRRCPATVATTE